MAQLETGITNILVQAILAIFGAMATYLTAVLVSYFNKKKELIIKQIGEKKYDSIYKRGRTLFYYLEEHFKDIPKSGDKKKDEFNKCITSTFPELTDNQVDRLREAIVHTENLKNKN